MLVHILFGVFIVSALNCVNSDANNSNSLDIDTLRLPNATKPLSYNLRILTNVHRSEFNFTGSVLIHLLVISHCNRIILHSKDLEIGNISLIDLSSNLEIANISSEYDTEKMFLTILSKSNTLDLAPGGEYLLSVNYSAVLRSDMKGFYKTSYQDSQNNTIWIATTQFEATSARRAFPCYDEPSFKARFVITITHGSNYSALSNMPFDGQPMMSKDGLTTTKFLETPLMSTYNVAFVVSNYEYITKITNNIEHRIFFPPKERQLETLVLNISISVLNEMQNYFDINYKLPKIDHFAVPDRRGEAMENWGLIIYRNSVFSKKSKSDELNVRTAIILAHELAHQWFGNLVTLEWWTYVWLNEGLATFYGMKILQKVLPELKISDYTIVNDLSYNWGEYHDMAPLQFVETENEISNAFNGASYFKVEKILQMFEHAIGEETFKKGVTFYLNKYQFSVADEDNFLDCLQQSATEDSIPHFKDVDTLKNAIKTWTHQKFHPLVTVTRNYENGSFTVRQESYSEKEMNENLWSIPITLHIEDDPNPDDTKTIFVFPPIEEMTVNLIEFNRKIEPNNWLILNKKQIGIYRVNYDEQNWKLITSALKRNSTGIHFLNRMQLIRDSVSLLLRNLLNPLITLEFLSYLKNEHHALAWSTAIDALLSMLYELEDTECYDSYVRFCRDIVHSKFQTISINYFKDLSLPSEVVNLKILKFACKLKLEECVNLVRSKFKDMEEGLFEGHKDIEKFVLCETLKNSQSLDFVNIYKQFIETKDKVKRSVLIECLSQSEDPKMIEFFLNSMLESEVYSPSERSDVITHISGNAVGLSILISFLKVNHLKMENLTTGFLSDIKFLKYQLRNDDDRKEYVQLVEDIKGFSEIKENFEDSIQASDSQIDEKQMEKILLWLQKYDETNLIVESNSSKKLQPYSIGFPQVLSSFVKSIKKFMFFY